MKKLVVIITFFCAALTFQNCENSSKNNESENTIKIGAILPLTGKYADIGNWMKIGIEYALLDLGDSSNIKIFYEDAMSEPSKSINAYNKLMAIHDIDCIITGTSSLSLALKPVVEKDSVLLFSIASHPSITSTDNNLVFRPCNTSVEEGNAIRDFLIERQNQKEVKSWILYHNSEFGNSFKDNITHGLSNIFLGSSPYDDKPENYRNVITKALNFSPNIITIVGFTPAIGTLIKMFRELGFEGEIICNIGFNSPSAITNAGEAANGIFYVDYHFPKEERKFQKYDSLAHVNFNTSFASMSYLSYGAIKIINQIINNNNSIETSNFNEYIQTYDSLNIDGIVFRNNNSGDILPDLFINKYRH